MGKHIFTRMNISNFKFPIKPISIIDDGNSGKIFSTEENDVVMKITKLYNYIGKNDHVKKFEYIKKVHSIFTKKPEDIFVEITEPTLLVDYDDYLFYYYYMPKLCKISTKESNAILDKIDMDDISCEFVRKLKNSRFIQTDLHSNNIMKNTSGDYIIIDIESVEFKGESFKSFKANYNERT